MADHGKKLLVACPPACQLNPQKVGPAVTAVLLAMRENGAGTRTMAKRATELLQRDRPYSTSSMDNHLKHYREMDVTLQEQRMPEQKLGDLEILDLVIQRGAANSLNWKPTIKDTIDAMKLKIQMTGNSAFDDLIALFDGVEGEDDEFEAPEALGEAAERPVEDDEPLGEVLIDA